jgi:hypothetical protein
VLKGILEFAGMPKTDAAKTELTRFSPEDHAMAVGTDTMTKRRVLDHLRKHLGANQDAFTEAGGMGIDAAGAANYSTENVMAAFVGTSKKIARMRTERRTGQTVSNELTEEEREEMN